MATEQDKWRKLLQPLITGLAGLAAATLYLQCSVNDNFKCRMSAARKNNLKKEV